MPSLCKKSIRKVDYGATCKVYRTDVRALFDEEQEGELCEVRIAFEQMTEIGMPLTGRNRGRESARGDYE